MAGIEFSSPGAAFATGVTDYLDKQKLQKRQDLLDSLQMNADKRAEAAAGLQKQEADQRMADARQAAEINRLNAIGAFMDEGDDISTLDPKDQDLLRRYHAIRTVNMPSTSTSVTSMTGPDGAPLAGFTPEQSAPTQPKTHDVFAGFGKDREHQRQVDETAATINALMNSDDPDRRKAGEILREVAGVSHGVVSGDTLMKLLPQSHSVYTYDYATHRVLDQNGKVVTGEIPDDAKVIIRPYAPEHPDHWFNVGMDAEGHPVMWNSNTRETSTVQGALRPSAKNGAATLEDTFKLPGTVTKPLYEAQGALGSDPNTVDPDALAAYRNAAATAALYAFPRTSVLGHLARKFIDNPEATMLEANKAIEAGKMTPAQLDELLNFTEGIAPGSVMDALRLHPYSYAPPKPNFISRWLKQ